MLDLYDYIAGWAIYLTAGTLCYMIFYRFTGVDHIVPASAGLTLRFGVGTRFAATGLGLGPSTWGGAPGWYVLRRWRVRL